jgi:hypothetical protein
MPGHKVEMLRDDLIELRGKLSMDEEVTTRTVAKQLRRLVGLKQNFGGQAFVQMPWPMPTGHLQAGLLWMDLWIYLRSPSCPERVRGRWFRPAFSEKAFALVRRHLESMIAMERHRGQRHWVAYLQLAKPLLQEDPRIERARQHNERYDR